MSATITNEDSKIAAFHGRLVDLDSHEITPTVIWEDVFGPAGRDFVDLANASCGDPKTQPNSFNVPCRSDENDVSDTNIWDLRPRTLAPGAFDMGRRVEVLDFIGIDRQIVFPGFGLMGIGLHTKFVEETIGENSLAIDPIALQSAVFGAHNRWAIEQVKLSSRLRPVAFLRDSSVSEMIEHLESLLNVGLRAFWLPSYKPPAGKSPGDSALDPFWALMEEADATVVNHLGGELGFYNSAPWIAGVPAFVPTAQTGEVEMSPYAFATLNIAPAHFLITMILGGVFERHPRLRFGAIECGAGWLAPLVENLDHWAETAPLLRKELSLRPTEYAARNVRVTPFHFERVDKYIERYGLDTCYCFSTDYPHVEGGKRPMFEFYETLAPLGDEVLEKFFVSNGRFLFP